MFSRFLRIGVFALIVVYVIIDVALEHPGNLLTVAGLALYILIFYVTSVNPAKVSKEQTLVHGLTNILP